MANLKYTDVVRHLKTYHSLTPEDFLKLERDDKARILKTIQRSISGEIHGWNPDNKLPKGIVEPSSFKNTQGRRQRSTKNQSHRIICRQEELQYIPYSFVMELGDLPISSDTMNFAKEKTDKLFGDLPRVEKLEESWTRNTQTHYQGLVLLPFGWKRIIVFDGCVVKFMPLGEKEEYKNLPMQVQVSRYTNYLKKPIDAKAHRWNVHRGLKPLALVNWFELMHSQHTGKTQNFRSFRAVNLGRQKVRFTLEGQVNHPCCDGIERA
jgi:hypothetical protein